MFPSVEATRVTQRVLTFAPLLEHQCNVHRHTNSCLEGSLWNPDNKVMTYCWQVNSGGSCPMNVSHYSGSNTRWIFLELRKALKISTLCLCEQVTVAKMNT